MLRIITILIYAYKKYNDAYNSIRKVVVVVVVVDDVVDSASYIRAWL